MEAKFLDVKNILKGILLSMVISIIAVGILSVFVYFMNISDKTVNFIVLAISAVSVFLGGLILAKNTGHRGLLNGLILAAGYIAVLMILTVGIKHGISREPNNLLRIVIFLASGMLGGIMGVNSAR